MSIKQLFAASVLALTVGSAGAQAPAEPSPTGPPPLEDYLKPPQIGNPTLSPNGKYLAVTTPVNGRLNLAVVDLETRKGTPLTNFGTFDVAGVRWVGNDRLMFSLWQRNSPTGPGQDEGGGLFMVSRDGKESRRFSMTLRDFRNTGQFVYRSTDFLRTIPGNTNEVMVSANIRSADAEDVYRLDLRNGRTTLVTEERPPYTTSWVLDKNLVPRVALAWIKDTTTYAYHYRKSADAPWEEIARTDQSKAPNFQVLGLLSDNKTLMVASNKDRDTMAIYKFDPDTRQYGELIAEHPRLDLGRGSVVLEPDTDRILGYSAYGFKLETVWIDEKRAQTQAMIDGALPGMLNAFTRFPNSKRLLVASYSDVTSTKYYLLDEEKRTMEELFTGRPWITKNHYVPQRTFFLKTRDGLEIPSYYFLPHDYKAGDKLPTVVHIHGGPQARADGWATGFGWQEAQILASRGYAVVLPNFRITPGFGAKILYSGFGSVGRQMSDDHEDAARWAIEQGFADPNRICISGASYGGYATLVALAKAPNLFKCGVAGLVVSDWEMDVSSTAGVTVYNPGSVAYWHKVLGQDDRNPTAMRDNSPVHMAKRIKGPVFMYAGAEDYITPLEQTNAMASALRAAGNPPKTVMIKKEEGHGYGRLENELDLYQQILKFLEASIGKGPTRP